MFGRKGCEDKRSSGQELFGTLQMLILHAVGLQLAFPSAADRWFRPNVANVANVGPNVGSDQHYLSFLPKREKCT